MTFFLFPDFFAGRFFLTARRIAAEPLFQLAVVLVQEVDVGLDEFEGLEERALAAADVHVAEERLHGLEVERVVEVRHGGDDEPADGERRPAERRLDRVPARLQLAPHEQRADRIARHRLDHRADVLHPNRVPLHRKVQIPVILCPPKQEH